MSPLRLAETFCAVVPLLGLSVTDAVLPYALVRPYSNCAVEALPLGLTVPFRVAVVCIMLVGAVTVTVGGDEPGAEAKTKLALMDAVHSGE